MSKRKKPKIEEGQLWLLPFDSKNLTVDKVDKDNDKIYYTFFRGMKKDHAGVINHSEFCNWIKQYHPKLAGSAAKIWKELNE